MSVLEVRAWLGPQVPHQSHCACRSCPKGGLGLDGRIGGAIWGTDARVLYACTCLCVRVGGCSVAYRSRLSGLTRLLRPASGRRSLGWAQELSHRGTNLPTRQHVWSGALWDPSGIGAARATRGPGEAESGLAANGAWSPRGPVKG